MLLIYRLTESHNKKWLYR